MRGGWEWGYERACDEDLTGKLFLTIVSVYSINLSSETSLIFFASLSKSLRKF